MYYRSTVVVVVFVIFIGQGIGHAVYSVADEIPITPGIPQPSPEPKPIGIPEPKPAPDPFAGESNSEKIKRLTEENNNLKNTIRSLILEKNKLELQIVELGEKIKDLEIIIREQIKIILGLMEKM